MRLTKLAAVLQLFYCHATASVEPKSFVHERGLEEGVTLGFNYKPTTDVSSALNIDVDQEMIENYLDQTTVESFLAAEDVYVNGTDNMTALTIQSLSLNAEKEYGTFDFFLKFKDYYGRADYADAWVLAAFDGESVTFGSRVTDMGLYGATGRSRKCLLELVSFNNVVFVDLQLTLSHFNSFTMQRVSRKEPRIWLFG